MKAVRIWYVTGTFHGSHVYARTEGDARRRFHEYYGGESITHVRCGGYPELIPDNDADGYQTNSSASSSGTSATAE